jgi:hypothetical protein
MLDKGCREWVGVAAETPADRIKPLTLPAFPSFPRDSRSRHFVIPASLALSTPREHLISSQPNRYLLYYASGWVRGRAREREFSSQLLFPSDLKEGLFAPSQPRLPPRHSRKLCVYTGGAGGGAPEVSRTGGRGAG